MELNIAYELLQRGKKNFFFDFFFRERVTPAWNNAYDYNRNSFELKRREKEIFNGEIFQHIFRSIGK